MTRYKSISMLFVLAFIFMGEDVSSAQENAPPFSLPRWGTEELISLEDFQGKIVILDFFYAGCGICFRASIDVKAGVQEFYNEGLGNPYGIDVQVVAVNSEVSNPGDIEAFIDETDLELVLKDSSGGLLHHYGGDTVPYLVVIDATVAEKGVAAPRVVYRQSGYKGFGKLKEVIDSITGRETAAESGTGIIEEQKPSFFMSEDENKEIINDITFDNAALIASDVFVGDTIAEYHRKSSSKEFSIAISYRRIETDYASEYFGIIREEHLTADRVGIQGSADFNINDKLKLKAEGGAYDGYQTYRALWLNQFYLQVFDVLREYVEDPGEYRKARPQGYNVSSGLRWEYLPYTGIAEVTIAYQHDIVSPGYEISLPVVRLRDTYDTISGRISFENVLTRRLRTLAEFRADDTTDRDPRFTLQGALNYALAEHWITRLVLTGSKEEPHFRSKSISAVLERDWRSAWFADLFGRYYEDTSEIANAVLSEAAAPPLVTYQVGLGVRLQDYRSSFKLVVGPCFSRYQRRNERNTAFDQLYGDRDWVSVQFAFLHQF